MELDLEWDRQLWWRRGAPQRLCGILVFYDFRWLEVFPDQRTHFKHGQRLAEGVQQRCPEGLEPALLLTRRTDVAQGLLTTTTYFLYVLNIDEWLAAEDDFALAYLATHLAVEPEKLGRFADLSLIGDPADDSRFLEQQLTVDRVAEWLQQDGERLERLAGLVDFRVDALTDVEHALDAIAALGDLDEHQIQQLIDFVTRLTDTDQRAVLIRGATTDQPGREAAAVVLHERVAERVADARRDLETYRALLDNPAVSETDMQDFLLERFDGYNDVVELKGPNEPILRSREQTPGSGVPTPHRYRLGKELADALPQALAYRDRLSRPPRRGRGVPRHPERTRAAAPHRPGSAVRPRRPRATGPAGAQPITAPRGGRTLRRDCAARRGDAGQHLVLPRAGHRRRPAHLRTY